MSIQTRLLLAASVVLLAFIGLCGAGLESAFRQSALDAEQNRLRGIVYALLGAAEQDEGSKLAITDADLPEQRLRQPDSGLEAAVLDESGAVLWHSPSLTDVMPLVIGADVGHWKFERIEDVGEFALSFGLRWIGEHQLPHRYTILVLEEPDAYETQLSVFRRTVWLWLLGAAVATLVALLMVLRWGLRPLSQLVRELKGVESGAQARIDASYPQELTPLTGALNAMIVSERNQLMRYRNALGDLAHSLKTPLAVLRGLAGETHWPAEPRRQLEEQVGHMQQITHHQLARAALAGRRALAQPVVIKPLADKLIAALGKVYAAKNLSFELDFAPDLTVRADSGDLYELLGNTLDNAAKWARSRVRLRAARNGARLQFDVEDNGPGFPAEAERLLQRGARADTRVPGEGLGLSAAAEIVQAYEGEILLERSADLGGARVVVFIP